MRESGRQEDMAEGVLEDIAENVAESVTESVTEDVIEGVTEDVAEDVAEEMTEGMAGEMTKSMPEDMVVNTDEATPGYMAGDIKTVESHGQRVPRIAVFASGSGSNFQALIDAAREQLLGGDIALLVCDKPQARVIERAKLAGVKAALFEPKKYASREEYEQDVLRLLFKHQIDFVVLAGYMRLVTPVLLRAYEGRMVNIHPSLLPSFPGMHAVRQALHYGVKVTGVTVHLVDEGMDTGPILAQQVVAVMPDDTEDTLSARIQQAEHALYPQVVQQMIARSLVKSASV